MDRFEKLLLAAQQGDAPQEWRKALVDVADTASICRAWLQEYAEGFTPADLLTMVGMVIQRQKEIVAEKAEEERRSMMELDLPP